MGRFEAEKWLREHDPDYENESEDWKHMRRVGIYERPRQEIPWGLGADLEWLVETGRASNERRGPKARGYVGVVDTRVCERCGEAFVPKNSWNRFCSTRCRRTAEKRRQRAATQLS